MRGGLMRLVKITFIVLLLVIFSIICSEQHIGVLLSLAESDNAEKADKLSEDFQKQSPWFREKPESGESKGTPQPELYQRTPEGNKKKKRRNTLTAVILTARDNMPSAITLTWIFMSTAIRRILLISR